MADDKDDDIFNDDIINQLMKENEGGFVINSDIEKQLKAEEEENRIDKVYSFEDFSKYINMDCLGVNLEECSGKSPFAVMAESMTKILDDGSLMKKVIREGTEQIPPDAAVYIHYNSYLELEEVPFDSSFLRSENPVRFQLGAGVLYSGMEIAITTMRKGEKSQFLVNPKLAFGKFGVPPRIPPNATILNVVELIDFVDCGDAVNKKDLETKSFEEVYKKANAFMNLAKDHFVHNLIRGALENYKKCTVMLRESCHPSNNEEDMLYRSLLYKAYINMIVCYNTDKINLPNKALEVARVAMLSLSEECRKSAKLFYNLGKAHESNLDYEKASRCYRKANKLIPGNSDIQQALIRLEGKQKEYYEKEKALCSKALGITKKKEKVHEALLYNPNFNLDHITDLEKQYFPYLEDLAQSNTSHFTMLARALSSEERYVLRTLSQRLNLEYIEEEKESTQYVTIKHKNLNEQLEEGKD